MNLSSALLAAVLAAAVAGCSSNSQNAGQQSSSAPANAAATETAGTAPVTAATTAAAPAAAAPLDVYPGATKLPTQMRGSVSFCNTKMTTIVYRVGGANAETVAGWYAAHVPGGIRINIPVDANSTTIEIFEPGGQAAAAITQMHYDPRLAAAAKSLGADRTTLGLVTFDPPLSSDWIDTIRAAESGDAAARARMKAKCGSGNQQ